MGYSAILRSHTPEAVDAFCDWIRGQPDSFEEMELSAPDQIFRFKVKSKKRRTGMICKKSDRFLFIGATAFHFGKFVSTWGQAITNGMRETPGGERA
jgi:hypothetical protein